MAFKFYLDDAATINLIIFYAPNINFEESEITLFYEKLNDIVRT